MNWKTVALLFCSGCTPAKANRSMRLSINHTLVNISSPTKFPSNHSVYCSWKVHVPSGFSIKIHFSSFDLQNSTNCSQEAVEIFVSRGLYLNIALGRYCGDLVPDDLFRNDFDVTVTYTAVPSGTRPKHPGFRASITLEAAEECSTYNDASANDNVVIKGSNGTFVSPIYSISRYSANFKCRWTIIVPRGHRIKFSFLTFHLGSRLMENCKNGDRIELSDSLNVDDPTYGTFCGNVAPLPIYSVGPRMVITFLSFKKRALYYFRARYDAISEGICTRDCRMFQLNLTHNSTGRLSSPDYPLQFQPDSACFWRLKAPHGYRVKLQFTTLNIQGNCREKMTTGAWVRVDDFFTTDFGSAVSFWGLFCSGEQPPVIYSTRNELQVLFTSNYTSGKQPDPSRNNGFYAIFEAVPQGNYTSRCRTDINPEKPIIVQDHNGSLVSPGYPYSYPIITCTWNIEVPDGYILVVNINDFEIDCASDNKLLLGEEEFCGSSKPGRLLTSFSGMKIQMITKKAENNRGFYATFQMRKVQITASRGHAGGMRLWVVVILSIAAFLLFLALAVVIFNICRRRRRRKKIARIVQKYNSEGPVQFENDVFISYSSKDYSWIEQSLLPMFDENNIKYIIHSRDFIPGKAFYENMVDSVYNSKKVIAVMSMNYLSSGFCKDEMRMAAYRCAERDDSSLIVIRIDNIKPTTIPKCLRHKTFIDSCSPEEVATWQNRVLECVQSDIISSSSVTLDEDFNEQESKRLHFSSFRFNKNEKQHVTSGFENQAYGPLNP